MRRPRPRAVRGQQTFYRLATGLLIVAVLYWGQVVLVPVALAMLFAFALSVPAEWVEKRGLPRTPASLLVAGLALAAVVGIGWAASEKVWGLTAVIQEHRPTVMAKVRPVLDAFARVEQALDPHGEQPSRHDRADPMPVEVVRPRGGGVLAALPGLAVPTGTALAEALLVAVLTVFLLVQRESVRDRLLGLAGRRQLTATTRALDDAGRRVGKYLLLQASTNAGMGLTVAGGLYLLGVPYPGLCGLLTAVLRFVPYLGVWTSALLPVSLALAVFDGGGRAFGVLALYAVADGLLTNVIEPMVFGRGTGVSSLALLVAAAFWAFLWGPVGLLLAVPLTVCLVVLGEHISALSFLRTLLGDEPQVDPAARYFHRVLAREFDQAALLAQEQAAARPLLGVYDEMILPALAQAKQERDRGELSADEERALYRVTRDVLAGVLAPARADAGAADPNPRPAARVVGCATKGEADRLALLMLRDVARPSDCEVDVVPAARFVEEVRARVGRGEAVVGCVAAVSPGGLAQAAGLCKRLAALKVAVVVGRWGVPDDKTTTAKFLTDAGATKVTWTLTETLAAIAPESAPKPSDREAITSPAGPDKVVVPA